MRFIFSVRQAAFEATQNAIDILYALKELRDFNSEPNEADDLLFMNIPYEAYRKVEQVAFLTERQRSLVSRIHIASDDNFELFEFYFPETCEKIDDLIYWKAGHFKILDDELKDYKFPLDCAEFWDDPLSEAQEKASIRLSRKDFANLAEQQGLAGIKALISSFPIEENIDTYSEILVALGTIDDKIKENFSVDDVLDAFRSFSIPSERHKNWE